MPSVRGLVKRFLLSGEDRALLERVKRELLPGPAAGWADGPGPARFDVRVDERAAAAFLGSLGSEPYPALFAHVRAQPAVHLPPVAPGVESRIVRNGYFPSPDAELYAAMIVAHRPGRIVEIGAGFSTVVARATIEHAGLGTELHVIDPQPRRPVGDLADRVELARVEESSVARLGIDAGTLLFIDSSHVVRAGGDGPFLYCRLLPSLPPGVLVHVHDIFLPYEYPRVYQERLYAEQYLLHALLSNSGKFEVLFATFAMSMRHGDAMRAAFGDSVATDDLCGASFWMRSTGPVSVPEADES